MSLDNMKTEPEQIQLF